MKTNLLCGIGLMTLSLLTTGCLDDVPKDKIKTVEISILPTSCVTETQFGVGYAEGMMAKSSDENTYSYMSFTAIDGFEYERGHEYKLSVDRTELANPPADGCGYTYSLNKVISDKEYPADVEEMTITVMDASTDMLADKDLRGCTVVHEVENDINYISTANPVDGFVYEYGNSYVYTLKVRKYVIKKELEYSGESNSYYELIEVLDKKTAL